MHDSIKHQIKKYNTQAKKHNEHYNDKYSQLYRDKFIRNLLFKGKNLKGVYILDAMCASGIETSYLLNKGAKVVGLDISKNNVKEFKKKFKAPCYMRSIHKTGFPKKTFDAVYICGGLHHVLPVLDKVIFEIERILKPNGYFYFMEPNAYTWVNIIRKFWYKIDSRFENDEKAIDYDKTLKPLLSKKFNEIKLNYGGNIAYLLIAQSLALNIPVKYKKHIAPFSFFLENFLTKIPIIPKLFFTSVWRKK